MNIGPEEQQLKSLASDHGLIFFCSSGCRYCHAMAQALKMLSERIEVLGLSVDGKSLPEFPNPSNGRTQAATWGAGASAPAPSKQETGHRSAPG